MHFESLIQFVTDHPIYTTIGTGLFVTGSGYIIHEKIILNREKRRLRELTLKKQNERKSSLDKLRQKYPFTPSRKTITEISPEDLIEKLQYRILSATEVLEAFTAKSIEINDKINCITEFIPQAFEWADKLDNLVTVKGPLHGVPFCIKEDTDVKGMDSSLGLAKFLYQPSSDSAVLVKTLRDLGAVPMCKTNLIQTLSGNGSDNPIFGQTLNALNPKLGPGGSSSGTGALIGAGGCFFGLGSDRGGSGRIPAHFNGISSIKPTMGRISSKGVAEKYFPGAVGCDAVPAIFSKSAKHLTTIFRSIIVDDNQRKYDPTVPPVPWNGKVFNSSAPLRIGYYTNLSSFPTIGDTEKVLLHAKLSLQDADHILVPFELPFDEFDIDKLVKDIIFGDCGEYITKVCYAEEISPSIEGLYDLFKLPYLFRLLSSLFVGTFMKNQKELYDLIRAGFDVSSTKDLWKCMDLRKQLIRRVLEIMENLHLDAIICPVFPFPALKVDETHKSLSAFNYTILWNLLDFPAGVVPFGYESGTNIDNYDTEGVQDRELVKSIISESISMPIGVQVIAKPFDEETVLRILVELEKIHGRSTGTNANGSLINSKRRRSTLNSIAELI